MKKCLKLINMTGLFIVLLYITMDTLDAADEKYCLSDNDQSSSCTAVSESEVHILLIGKAGAGKSTTGNTILGQRAFDTSASVDAVTMTTQQECADRFGRHLCVIDTPGLFDTSRTNKEVMDEITKWHVHASDVVHAVVLVVELGRYTEEDQHCENVFREHFGHDIMNYVIVAFTGKNKLDNDNIDIEAFISNMKPNSALRLLLREVKDRYIVLGLEKAAIGKTSGMSSAQDDVNEVKRLLKIIRTVGQTIKGEYYTKEKMKIAQKFLRKVEEEKLSEMKKKHEKETEEIMRTEKAKQAEERIRLKEEFEREENEKRRQMEKLFKEREIAEIEKERLEEELKKQRIKHGLADPTVYFRETFDDGYESRWVQSTQSGKFIRSTRKYFGDAEKINGLQTSQHRSFYGISAKFDKFSNEGKTLVIQFTVKHEQDIGCGGGYVKVFGSDLNQEDLNGESPYNILFGPDICGLTKEVLVIFNYKGQNLFIKKHIRCRDDAYTHLYTLILRPDDTYEVKIDNTKVESGSLESDWDFPKTKKIEDSEDKDPEDWDLHSDFNSQEYEAVESLYKYSDIGAIGFELWQKASGTIFDNILITDDVVYAENDWQGYMGGH